MDTSDRRPRPENTQELLPMWSAAKEQEDKTAATHE